MEHLSPSRLDWIDGRLFTLARTERQLRANGLRWANGHQMAPSSHEAALMLQSALALVNTERLALMAERAAINEYTEEQKIASRP